MSWDVVIVNSKGAPAGAHSSPEGSGSEPLGDPASVRELISSVLPVDWSDPSCGLFEGEGFTIEFSIDEDEDPVTDAMLHVRGGGDPLPSIVRVCKRGGWLAIDAGDGTAIDLDNPSRAGWEAFVGFRDQVLAKARSGALDLEGAGASAEASLPGSDLFIEDGKLIQTNGNKQVVASHALSQMRNLRFGAGTRLFALVTSGIAIFLAAASKMWIATGWLSWGLTVIFGLVALVFLRAVRGQTLWFFEGGTEHSYALFGSSDEIGAFSAALRRACQEARGKR